MKTITALLQEREELLAKLHAERMALIEAMGWESGVFSQPTKTDVAKGQGNGNEGH